MDNDGKRLIARYYTDDFPTVREQKVNVYVPPKEFYLMITPRKWLRSVSREEKSKYLKFIKFLGI